MIRLDQNGPAAPAQAAGHPESNEARLRQKATELEASFLAEMLKLSGVGKPSDSFGGGAGEEQFTSFLCDEYARIMAQAGGIGLAETIFHSLQKGADHAK